MKNFLLQIFTWWNGQTLGTRFFTWRFGHVVGQDEFGNTYYEGGKNAYGFSRRWVVYKGYTDPSSIPPMWHGWIHHRRIDAPQPGEGTVFNWQKPHRVNSTGSENSYSPGQQKNNPDNGNKLTGKYSAWSPDC
ncbi:NADH:ubiquinone oxidoreductase subunit NDUFA12 [Candidatus Liberibacter solanacearum]|uniref:NADH:ubiquinone oxidoreductase subunit NDUFA12 n=1 Tax=Candidatus Liberibacter solanacearum TaxID=556287 RepID=A0A1V2N8U2_9HYPH|nr:NADH:ubiquinone oxidoreductase subunit NDUFA12 [Candidatus Liberibacter solanacearum]ONI58392.1 NADH dehydrogenase [Candidatus Liberibacter solanacearum]ONI60132.1 NADH:ubiquinone oxidoreductase subunit NDUFA12 [Candidatus Liberibacter solanacearum]